MTSDAEILQRAQAGGKWGFMLDYAAVNGQDLLTTQVPNWAARAWLVQLNAYRYQRPPLSSQVNSVNADGQTATLIRAKLRFGNDAGYEEAVVDYPLSGCTFPVHAALLRVSIDPPAEAISFGITPTPMIGGMLSPSNTARGAVDSLGPTFTTQIPSLAGTSTVIVNIPRRACAYKLMYTAQSLAPVQLCVSQTVGQTATVFTAWDYGGAAAGDGEFLYEDSGGGTFISIKRRAPPIPLLPFSNSLTIQNKSATATSLQVQFLLDLG